MRIMNEGDFLPRYLKPEELENPHQVIYELFEFNPLPAVRELLWEFFKTMVTGTYNHNLDRRERQRLGVFYENMQRLIEAVHLIYQKEKYLKDKTQFDPNEFFKTLNESLMRDGV